MAINNSNTENTFRYANETFSGCDMVASISIAADSYDENKKQNYVRYYNEILGTLTTISYSIYMQKTPVRSIGNVNAKDYVMGPRTIAGSLVFNVFNEHVAKKALATINDNYKAGVAFLVDELPPFDITISAANEYGYRSRMAIYGVRLLNEGQVMSINDVYTENTYQFYATDLEYLDSEKKYIRNNSTKMYILKDNLEVHSPQNNLTTFDYAKWRAEQSKNFPGVQNSNIKLSVITKQPTRNNAIGYADFFVDPSQEEGILYVTNSNGEVRQASISTSKSSYLETPITTRLLSMSLTPDRYTAYFQNTKSKKISNTVAFSIIAYSTTSKLYRYAPLIEKIIDTEISIFANEPSHTRVKIYSSDAAITQEYSLTRRRCTITGLSPNTKYTLYTYNDSDKIPSKEVQVTTLTAYDRLFDELLLFTFANSADLAFVNDMNIYKDLLNESKIYFNNSNSSTTDCLLELKKKYLNLYKSTSDKIKAEQYDLKIKAINELLQFSNRLFNDFIAAVNDKVEVPVPTMKLNDYYENIFTFDKDITKAEFYKDYGNIAQFDAEVLSYNFKNIDGVDNSFRYFGRPGHKHYVEALMGTARSAKLEFYVMTQQEKDEFIAKDLAKQKLSQKDIDIIDKQIQEDVKVIETDDYKRSFIINAKRISNAKFLPPEIETINENVLVKTSIYELLNNDHDFYIALATYEDILCNNSIYKIKFKTTDEVIAITKLLHGLKKDSVYGIWIEDSNYNQISNASTFIYSDSFALSDDNVIKEYEIKDFIDDTKKMAEDYLPTTIQENINCIIENNNTLANYDLVNGVLSTLVNVDNKKIHLLKFLSSFKKYIGTIGNSKSDLITDIDYTTGFVKFNCNSDNCSLLLYSMTADICTLEKEIINEGENSINATCYEDSLLIAVIDELNLSKSNIIFINKKEDYMEVL